MAQRSKILTLPDEVKGELDKRLVAGGFAGYEALSGWLSDQGFEISKSAIHRYGQEFEDRLSAIKVSTEQARAVVAAAHDEGNDVNEALIRLVQHECFNVLIGLNEEQKQSILPKLGIMVAKLSKASVDQKKWMAETRAKAKQAAETVEKKLTGAIDPETLRKVREEIYGIVS